MNTLDTIRNLIKQDRLDEALTALNALIAANSGDLVSPTSNDAVPEIADQATALFLRGKIHWRLGNRSEAQNDYLASAALDPSGPATAALEAARTIEAFFNPDLLNP